MPSKLRMALLRYGRHENGYNIYRGGDVVRFLEQYAGRKLKRPLDLRELQFYFGMLKTNEKKDALHELYIWRSKAGFVGSGYSRILNQSNLLLRWPPANKAETARRSNKAKEKKKITIAEALNGVRIPLRRVVVEPVDPEFEPEPRDR